jgi:hypothetical protein
LFRPSNPALIVHFLIGVQITDKPPTFMFDSLKFSREPTDKLFTLKSILKYPKEKVWKIENRKPLVRRQLKEEVINKDKTPDVKKT